MTLSYIPSDTNDEGILKAAASGSLPNGKPVIVNADGTVSVVAEIAGQSEAIGTQVEFEQGAIDDTTTVYDSNSNRIVVAYSDQGNSNYGTAVVGTVDTSDNSISFGSAVVFESANTIACSAAFDSNSNKVVIAFRDGGNSSHGTAIVGTVDPSDNSISFGSAEVFNSGSTPYISATFDSNVNKVLVSYRDSGNSSRGTSVVGTVSNTSISFGSEAVFDTGGVDYVFSTFDSDSSKVVISYRATGDSDKGKAVVATISGTSVSFGDSVLVNDAATSQINLAYDSYNKKIVIAMMDGGSSEIGIAKVGTVSGTTISFGAEATFLSNNYVDYISVVYNTTARKIVISYRRYIDANNITGQLTVAEVSGTTISFLSNKTYDSGRADFISSVYDPTSNRVIISYRDVDNSAKGASIVYKTPFAALPNVTTENYIGISTGGTYASGSNATIKIIGNTSNEQSSLTAGQAYYVQTDGTLGTTADDPSVFAGTAVSATKLIVKT